MFSYAAALIGVDHAICHDPRTSKDLRGPPKYPSQTPGHYGTTSVVGISFLLVTTQCVLTLQLLAGTLSEMAAEAKHTEAKNAEEKSSDQQVSLTLCVPPATTRELV